ncbi:hypothetical protein BT96DRAFT_308724 [Gymnopus androsaceus JB14]|uniref:Uncharacterized protein n=1 Tax=Gymnopus androsaceus JB14 TaxID=1447944 RepID=A0A6A4GA15_9AGAR|nr:hypothetical protein BT96DRAFT_308724 [Gymnopus androsaceus JB14]
MDHSKFVCICCSIATFKYYTFLRWCLSITHRSSQQSITTKVVSFAVKFFPPCGEYLWDCVEETQRVTRKRKKTPIPELNLTSRGTSTELMDLIRFALKRPLLTLVCTR